MSRVWVRATDARNDPRRRRRELRTNEYETGEAGGGEEEVEVAGAGGEDPVAVPAGRDEHRRRRRDGRGREGRIEDGNPDALPRIAVAAAPVPVRIGGVAEERVGEGEGDEAGRRDAPQALQLRAHRHRALAATATAGGGCGGGPGWSGRAMGDGDPNSPPENSEMSSPINVSWDPLASECTFAALFTDDEHRVYCF